MSGDSHVTDLCGRLFAHPAAVVQAVTHAIGGRYRIEPHSHRDVLQFDLFEHCAGRAYIDQRWHDLAGISTLVAYPGMEHGYELTCGRVYNVKLQVRRTWPALRSRPWSTVCLDIDGGQTIGSSLRVVTRLGLANPTPPALMLTRLAEVLCLWPRGDGQGESAPLIVGDELEVTMARAVDLIEHRLHDPPSVQQLANVAAYSTRHFTRRFHALFGCTPHAYITARRFSVARQRLIEDRRNISVLAGDLGFSSVSAFSRWFTKQSGVSPSDFREDPSIM